MTFKVKVKLSPVFPFDYIFLTDLACLWSYSTICELCCTTFCLVEYDYYIVGESFYTMSLVHSVCSLQPLLFLNDVFFYLAL
jgi:hypothetical protein